MHASLYRLHRPKTPDVIARDVVRYVEAKRPRPLRLAIDVGCGSGQNTFAFAKYFKSVIGTDISAAQVAEAETEQSQNDLSNVRFAVSSSEDMSHVVPECHSVDLLVGSMCFHWLDLDRFYAEARRVLASDGAIVALGHETSRLCHPTCPERSEQLSRLVPDFERRLLPYTASELSVLVNSYHDLPFPFEDRIRVDDALHVVRSPLADYLGNLMTWSAFQRFQQDKPEEALAVMQTLRDDIIRISGCDDSHGPDDEVTVHVKYNYFYLMGRVR